MSLIITKNFKRAKAEDAEERNAASDELNVGDKIWITQYGRNYPYTITKKWKEGWTVWYKAKNDKSGKEEIVAGAFANALDAAEFRVVHAKGIGKWWVEPNLSRFNDADRERIQKGRKEFPDREAAMKYARGTGKTFIVNDACDAMDAAAKDKAPDGWWKGKTIFAAFGWGKSVKGKVVSHKGGVIKLEDGTTFKESDAYDLYAIDAVSTDSASDAAEFHVGQRVRAKDPRWTGYQGHALGNGVYTVKKVDRDGTVKLDGFLDVWISPSALVEANDACVR